jgi:DNA replication protein DnaC
MTMIAADHLPAQVLERMQAQRWARLTPEQIQRHVRFQLQQARIPAVFRACTFQNLEQIQDLEVFRICQTYAENGEYEGRKGLLLMGIPGNGKTSLAVAILRRTVEQTQGRYSVRFWNVPTGLTQLRQSFDGEQEAGCILDLICNRLLVVDDLGKQQLTPWVQGQLHTLVENLWSEGRQVVITTNQTPAQLKNTLDPSVVSRLLDMCSALLLRGKDLRIREGGR